MWAAVIGNPINVFQSAVSQSSILYLHLPYINTLDWKFKHALLITTSAELNVCQALNSNIGPHFDTFPILTAIVMLWLRCIN